jgi:hypothetical protein
MNRREHFRCELENAIKVVEAQIEDNESFTGLYSAWRSLTAILRSPEWLETSADTKRCAIRRLSRVQGETMHRAARGNAPGLYMLALEAAGVTWRHLRLIDSFQANLRNPDYHLEKFVRAMSAQIRSSAANFRLDDDSVEHIAVDHFLEVLEYFGQSNGSEILVNRGGVPVGNSFTVASMGDLIPPSELVPNADGIVILSAASSGTLAVVATVEKVSVLDIPAFTTEWLEGSADRLQENPPGDFLEAFLDSLWWKLAYGVVSEVESAVSTVGIPQLIWCPMGVWRRVPILGARSRRRQVVETLLYRSVSTILPSPWALGGNVPEFLPAKRLSVFAALASNTRLTGDVATLSTSRVVGKARQCLGGTECNLAVVDDPVSADQILDGVDGSDVAHFYCHGHTLEGHAVPSLLFEAAAIGWEDLALRTFQRPRIALLTACETARMKELQVADGHSVMQALFERGIPLVVGSLWGMDDAFIEILSASFYERLAVACQSSPAQTRPLELVRAALIDSIESPAVGGGLVGDQAELWAGIVFFGA